jgi:hypothetical protein
MSMPLIVIGTTPGREAWLSDCLKSIGRDCLVLSDSNHELGKIRFLFLHDSCVVKKPEFFDLLDGTDSISINNCPAEFGSYLGVYTRETLAKVYFPSLTTRRDAINHEISWGRAYAAAGPWRLLFTDLTDQTATEIIVRHGRQNLVLENEFLIKYKGTWS